MKKSCRALLCLLAVCVLSIGILPSASALFQDRLYYYGTVEEIERSADGTVESILVSSEENEDYQMLISDHTVWKDYEEQTSSDPATLAVGEAVCVVHSSAVMMSLPPQSNAYTVIRNFPQGTDLEKEERSAACPIKKFFAKTRKSLENWFYQTSPIVY